MSVNNNVMRVLRTDRGLSNRGKHASSTIFVIVVRHVPRRNLLPYPGVLTLLTELLKVSLGGCSLRCLVCFGDTPLCGLFVRRVLLDVAGPVHLELSEYKIAANIIHEQLAVVLLCSWRAP